MSSFVPKILFAIQNEEKKARIKTWKQRMQTSKRDLRKWLKKGQDVSAGVLLNTEGQPTANKDEIFAAILHAWNGIFNKFASGSPPTQPFLDIFGPTMRTAPCQLQPLTAERLRASLRDMKQSPSGLDSWNANELKTQGAQQLVPRSLYKPFSLTQPHRNNWNLAQCTRFRIRSHAS